MAAKAAMASFESIVFSSLSGPSRRAVGAHVSRHREQACRARSALGDQNSRRSKGRTAVAEGDNPIRRDGDVARR